MQIIRDEWKKLDHYARNQAHAHKDTALACWLVLALLLVVAKRTLHSNITLQSPLPARRAAQLLIYIAILVWLTESTPGPAAAAAAYVHEPPPRFYEGVHICEAFVYVIDVDTTHMRLTNLCSALL